MTEIFFNVQIDCESTQRTINDPALGERSIRGLGDIFSETGVRGTFVVIPSDMRVHAGAYRELEAEGSCGCAPPHIRDSTSTVGGISTKSTSPARDRLYRCG